MVKMIVQDTKISTLVNLPLLFRMEAHAYTKVLPVLGAFGPPYICADPNIIIMEDLAEKGYVNCERRNYLDLDHTVYALKVRFSFDSYIGYLITILYNRKYKS